MFIINTKEKKTILLKSNGWANAKLQQPKSFQIWSKLIGKRKARQTEWFRYILNKIERPKQHKAIETKTTIHQSQEYDTEW